MIKNMACPDCEYDMDILPKQDVEAKNPDYLLLKTICQDCKTVWHGVLHREEKT